MKHTLINREKNIYIRAGEELSIGKNVIIGENIQITVKGKFKIGDFSNLGSDLQASGNNIVIGNHFFHSKGLRIGGGGRFHPSANVSIGDRCVMHNNFINACEPVEIGNDVGLSPEVRIITHGYWNNVFEGFPAVFKGVKIGNGVIIGDRSTILMGVEIAEKCVIGANSNVTKSLIIDSGVYGGNPAKMIRRVDKDSVLLKDKEYLLNHIAKKYQEIAQYHGFKPTLLTCYPFFLFEYEQKKFAVNVETLQYEGEENEYTDDLRDYIRKWGIRIYTERPFVSHFNF